MERKNLALHGVQENNLKNLTLEIPLGCAVVVTGPSGSGKSTLAFDTVYAEGQRRYMQSLSTYARQFLQRFKAPKLEHIANVPPTIALEQVNPVRNSRATVGTTTEIYDYLRLLFEKVGTERCQDCQNLMQRTDHGKILTELEARFSGESILVGTHKTLPKKTEDAEEFLQDWMRTGYTRIIHGGNVHRIEEIVGQKKFYGKTVFLVLDRLRLRRPMEEGDRIRLAEAINNAWDIGNEELDIYIDVDGKYKKTTTYYKGVRCRKCGRVSTPKTAALFSFNSPLGACETCKGFGNTLEVDPHLVIPNTQLTLAQGAVDPFTKPSLSHWQKKMLTFAKKQRIDCDLPYTDLPKKAKEAIWEGGKGFKGVRGVFAELEAEKYKMRIRVFVSRYISPRTCQACQGNRIKPEALAVEVDGRNMGIMCDQTLSELLTFFESIHLNAQEQAIAEDILAQLKKRLQYLNTVGLNYLTLARLTKTLSGGEYQRILLATQLSQGLCDTMYVLDEPSIGLHPKDTQRLISVLNNLKSQGNSLLIVEHDPEIIEWGDYIIDMGPESGSRGGEIVFSGSAKEFQKSKTPTAMAVKNWRLYCSRKKSSFDPQTHDQWLELTGACGNNLKNVDVRFPLGCLISITGVSGSGKSTLITETLYQALAKLYRGRSEPIMKFNSLSGFEQLDAVELVDQSPIGRSSRSNPITFVKAYDEIRALFAATRHATSRGYAAGHFSFNVPGGRCDTCEGEGRVKVDMVFMEDVHIPCEDCDGKRFKRETLAVRYKGKNIDEVLSMTIEDARHFFSDRNSLAEKLNFLVDVGLGYLTLGQPGFTLSGGEAQRLKIAKELLGASRSYKRTKTLFVLDEPTTGLHFDEIQKLLKVFRSLVKLGHTVLVIEHNLQVICNSDYIIDLGPGGGDEGGTIVGSGTPKQLAERKLPHTGAYLAEILAPTSN